MFSTIGNLSEGQVRPEIVGAVEANAISVWDTFNGSGIRILNKVPIAHVPRTNNMAENNNSQGEEGGSILK